ncbi:MAG: DUF4160 domain-containing protein [Bacillota bacterium]
MDINTLEIIEGDLPYKAVSLVKEWGAMHKTELMDTWNNQVFNPIAPLE